MRVRRRPDSIAILAILVALGLIITSFTQRMLSNSSVHSKDDNESIYSQNKHLQDTKNLGFRSVSSDNTTSIHKN